MELYRFMPTVMAMVLPLGFVHGDSSELNIHTLSLEKAKILVRSPIACSAKEFPQQEMAVFLNATEAKRSYRENHPIFFGCFTWGSSIHGHWLMASLAARFPGTEISVNVTGVFDLFNAQNVAKEKNFVTGWNDNYERPYGWAWLLELYAKLDVIVKGESGLKVNAESWRDKLKPLADHIVMVYANYLEKLHYAVRYGKHENTAFGLIGAYKYAKQVRNHTFARIIKEKAIELYGEDVNCPLAYEPGNLDFISPCFQEAELLATIYQEEEKIVKWLRTFLPQLFNEDFDLKAAKQENPDKLLDNIYGLNFSRAWNLYNLVIKLGGHVEKEVLQRWMKAADKIMLESTAKVLTTNYAQGHWLGTYYMKAFQGREVAQAVIGDNDAIGE